MKKALIAAMFIACAAASCKKKSTDNPAAPAVSFTFNNNVPSQVHLNIYGSAGDYYNNNTPLLSTDVAMNGSYTATNLTSGKEYYADWYSPDFSYNNWSVGNSITSLFVGFTPSATNTSGTLTHPANVDFSRIVLLNGATAGSSWHAVQILVNNINYWDSSQFANDHVHSFVFRKNFTGLYSSYNNGQLSTRPIIFTPDSRNQSVPVMTCPVLNVTGDTTIATIAAPFQPGSVGHVGKDTITAAFPGTLNAKYVLVRD